MLYPKKHLPEGTIGRAGYDLFSSAKDLTVIMIPFERFSPFAKAVDDLYKSIDIPFNLIVIEGNAPESVRASLEKRQRKYKNITIIYSEHQTSIGAAINLAAPHLKTKYAFIVDNDVRIPHGAMGKLLDCAKEKKYGIVCPQNYVILPRDAASGKKNIQSLGVRTCFLVSREALTKLGKFDEDVTPFTVGIDIRMAAEEYGISICNETSTRMELEDENLLWPIDVSFHSFQWNKERVHHSFRCLEEKWGIRLSEQDYALWLERKKRDLEESKNILFFLASLISKIKFSTFEKPHKESKEFLLAKAA